MMSDVAATWHLVQIWRGARFQIWNAVLLVGVLGIVLVYEPALGEMLGDSLGLAEGDEALGGLCGED